MTLSISATKSGKKQNVFLTYLGLSAFLGLFSFIYEKFSFGVYSNAMIFLFAIPLLAGAVPSFILKYKRMPDLPRLYHDGVLMIICGRLLQGIFEIYGTSSVYTVWFIYAGAALMAVGVLTYILQIRRHR